MSRKPKNPKNLDHTAAQILAADPTQSVWVSANAGTGKTHVLIERILRLLLAGTSPRRILALTFTKAAAAEVANRLSRRLGVWAAMSEGELEKALRDLLGKPPTDDQRATARKLFAATLETPEGLNVRTIHSFAESLLGRFPIEANVPPHFAVIDERRAAEIRSEAQAHVLAAAATGRTAIGDAMTRLAGLVTPEDFHKLMADLDRSRGRLRRARNRAGGVPGLVAALRRRQGIADGDTTESLTAAASRDGAFDATGLTRAAEALDEGSAGDKARAEAIRRWLRMEPARRGERFLDDYAPIFMTQAGLPKAEKNVITKEARKKDPGAADVLLAEQERVAAVTAKVKSVAVAEATEALFAVGAAMLDAYDAVKRASALRDYDDLIDDAGRLLADDDGVGWVHYKLDGGIDHILVDEAQDTSPDQWHVVERLAGDFFTGRGAGDDDRPGPRTVFAVGDEKQSIFSFQGADPAVFGQTRGHFAEWIAAIGDRLQDVELERSHRSSPAVLKVVDKVFENPAARDGLSFGDRPIVHHTERDGQAGLVELWPTLTLDDTPDPRPWDWPFDKPSPASPPVRLADRIAATIAGWLDNKEILESAGRPITPGDIMILVRTRGTFADQMVKALERRDIPVAGRDRLRLLDHIAVMDLVAAGRFALLPDDDLNTATVLKGPFVGFDDDDLFALAHGRHATLWETLTGRAGERPDFAAARTTLAAWLARADLAPPFEFYSRLLGKDGRKRLIARLGAEVIEPVEGFLAQALDFERDHEPSLQAFLHWLALGATEIKREMERGRDQVRVLTVHGAKGLEAGIVFLPDTCTLPEPRFDPRIHWVDGEAADGDGAFALWRTHKADEDPLAAALRADARADIEREYRRLLYVAMTRARDRLYVCGFENKNGRRPGCWYDLIAPAVRALGGEAALPTGNIVTRVAEPQTARPDGEAARPPKADVEPPPAWALAAPPPEPESARPLTPSRADDEPAVSSPLGREDGQRFKRGLIVHRLLQTLPDMAPEKRAAAARALLARPVLALAGNAQDEIVAETLAVLEQAEFAHLFRPGSLAEVPIVGLVGDGARAISGQIDRLVVTDDAVTIVDYKTNRPPPQREDDVAIAYLRQMAAYRWAVRRIYPDRAVEAVLLWTAGPSLMPLSARILDAYAP